MEELPKLSRYQKFIMVFFVTVIVLLLFPSFVPKTFIVSTVLNNVGATGILLGAVGVYIMVSLKEACLPSNCSPRILAGPSSSSWPPL